jgi:hypothetical protein
MIRLQYLLFLSALSLVSAGFLAGSVWAQTEGPEAWQKNAPAPAPSGASSNLMQLYDDQVRLDSGHLLLDQPHRTDVQVAEWAMQKVSLALNVDPTSFEIDQKNVSINFDPYGFQEYKDWLTKSGILPTLQAQKLRMNSFAQGTPLLLSEGALEGSYRWLFEIPLMISYYDQATKSLKGKRNTDTATRTIRIRVQVGRSDAQEKDGLLIERWSIAGAEN